MYQNSIEKVPKEIFNFILYQKPSHKAEEIRFLKNCFVSIQNFEPAAHARDYERKLEDEVSYQPMPELLQDYLRSEFLAENPLINPPLSIIKEGKQEISNYYRQIEKESGKTQRLFEAKLLVIGEGGTGKTTFIYFSAFGLSRLDIRDRD